MKKIISLIIVSYALASMPAYAKSGNFIAEPILRLIPYQLPPYSCTGYAFLTGGLTWENSGLEFRVEAPSGAYTTGFRDLPTLTDGASDEVVINTIRHQIDRYFQNYVNNAPVEEECGLICTGLPCHTIVVLGTITRLDGASALRFPLTYRRR